MSDKAIESVCVAAVLVVMIVCGTVVWCKDKWLGGGD